jgi:hypothetical protein
VTEEAMKKKKQTIQKVLRVMQILRR